MRAACLALALCVSYVAAADIKAPELADSELTTKLTTVGERPYFLANLKTGEEIEYTTVKFTVTGVSESNKASHGCFLGDKKIGNHPELKAPVTAATEQKCTVKEVDAGAEFADLTYEVYTGTADGKRETIAASKSYPLGILDLKSSKPEKWVIARDGCSVKFDILGLYSNPPLHSVCGFYQDKWVEETLVHSGVDGSGWKPMAHPDDEKFAAWQLEKSLEVEGTVPEKDVYAGCKFYVDGQEEYAEFELTQMIPFTANEKMCEANPLVAFGESYEGDNEIAVTSFGTTEENCWTGETFSTSQITCDNSKAFTVFCQNGQYMYTDSSVDKPAKYDSNTTALAFADETCGTGALASSKCYYIRCSVSVS